MNFNFGAIGALFSNPVILGVFIFIVLLFVGLIAFYIITRMRGGFGRFTRPKDISQRCISITSANVLMFYKLRVYGDYVMDERNQVGHFLLSDALIPERTTGQFYLPIDDRAASPHYPLEPELLNKRYKQVKDSMKFIAAIEDQKQRQEANVEARSERAIEMQKFALICAFGLVLVIVIGILIMKIT